MGEKTIARGIEDLATMYKVLFLDLPLTSTRRGLGMGQEKESMEAMWQGYDAWVRLSTTTIDDLYRIPLFGEAVARSLNAVLRWQQLSNAMVGASFAWLWPAVGLPTAATVQGLRTEIQALREELHSSATDFLLAAPLQTNGKAATHFISPREALHAPAVDLLSHSKASKEARNLVFPAGHVGAVVSASAQKKLWPQVGAWLKDTAN